MKKKSPQQLEEEKRLRRAQRIVDFGLAYLWQVQEIRLIHVLVTLNGVRNFVLELFPDKAHTFNLIYKPRFLRVIEEKGLLDDLRN